MTLPNSRVIGVAKVSRAAQCVVEENRGALDRVLTLIGRHLPSGREAAR